MYLHVLRMVLTHCYTQYVSDSLVFKIIQNCLIQMPLFLGLNLSYIMTFQNIFELFARRPRKRTCGISFIVLYILYFYIYLWWNEVLIRMFQHVTTPLDTSVKRSSHKMNLSYRECEPQITDCSKVANYMRASRTENRRSPEVILRGTCRMGSGTSRTTQEVRHVRTVNHMEPEVVNSIRRTLNQERFFSAHI